MQILRRQVVEYRVCRHPLQLGVLALCGENYLLGFILLKRSLRLLFFLIDQNRNAKISNGTANIAVIITENANSSRVRLKSNCRCEAIADAANSNVPIRSGNRSARTKTNLTGSSPRTSKRIFLASVGTIVSR
jgi:hypothetical protein